MAHSPRQEGANPAPGSRHKRKFEGVAASAGWRGRLARAWAAEERRHRVAGQQPSLHDTKVVAQFRSTIWRPPNDNHHGPNPIARLRLCDCDAWNGPSGRARDLSKWLLPSKGNRATRDIRKTAAHEA